MNKATESRLNELIFLCSNIEPKAVTSSSSSPTGALSKGRQSKEDPPLHFGSSVSVSLASTSSSAVSTQQLETISLDSPSGRDEEMDSSKGTVLPAKETTKVNQDGTIRVPSGSGFRIMTPFPWRLHEILEEVEKEKLDWIVSWLPNGRGFKIHCQKSFSEIIIPRFFRSSRYKSFQRQLYLYGFRSMETHNMSRGAYFHPKFVKSDRSLCQDIARVKMEMSQRAKKEGKGKQRTPRKYQRQQPPLPASMNHEAARSGIVPPSPQKGWLLQQPQQMPPTYLNDSLNFANSDHSLSNIAPTNWVVIQDDSRSGVAALPSMPEFSDRLLGFSEDIIGLFGPPSAEAEKDESSFMVDTFFQLAG